MDVTRFLKGNEERTLYGGWFSLVGGEDPKEMQELAEDMVKNTKEALGSEITDIQYSFDPGKSIAWKFKAI